MLKIATPPRKNHFWGGFFVNLSGIAGHVALEPDQYGGPTNGSAVQWENKGAPCLIFAKLSLTEKKSKLMGQ